MPAEVPVNAKMTSTHESILSGADASVEDVSVDLGVDPSEEICFSWSGLKLVIDLGIDPSSECDRNFDAKTVDPVLQHIKALEDCQSEHDGSQDDIISPEISPRDTIAREGPKQVTHGKEKGSGEAEECEVGETYRLEKDYCEQVSQVGNLGAGADAQRNLNQTTQTQCTWPDWGDPLPPEDDDAMVVDYAEVEKNPIPRKVVTFSEVVTIVEPSIIQEERETGSFSYTGSSDDELEQGTDQVTSSCDVDVNLSDHSPVSVEISPVKTVVTELLPSTNAIATEDLNSEDDVSAAQHLLELSNEANHVDTRGKSRRRKRASYDPSHDLDRLTELVEKIYASLPPCSNISSPARGSVSSGGVSKWTIEVSKDSGRVRMKRIAREKEKDNADFGLEFDIDDDTEVLDRPPSKRRYKSIASITSQLQ